MKSFGRLSTVGSGFSTVGGRLYIRARRALHNLKYCTAFIHSDGLQGCRVALYPCLITLSPTRLAAPQATSGRGTGGGYTDIRVVLYITTFYPEKTKKGCSNQQYCLLCGAVYRLHIYLKYCIEIRCGDRRGHREGHFGCFGAGRVKNGG